jgi:4-hydroxy-tetrahydrodipicolinate synthase
MRPERLNGIIIAMPTPLLKNEDIDIPSLYKLIDYCIHEGANGIMLAGTMGEGPALIASQRQLLVEASVAHAAGRVPILATVSAPSTRKTLEHVKAIEKSGVDYIVCTSPFYYKYPDPDSLIWHIRTIADATDTPIIFYNASNFTGNQVSVDTTEEILNMKEVVGIKDSSCNFRNFAELLRRYPDKENRPGTIMQGDESVFDGSLLMGADGIVSGGGIFFIKLLLELYHAGISKDIISAMTYQQKFSAQMSDLLMPNPQRDWVYKIKNRLANMNIIENGYVTTPFYNSAEFDDSKYFLLEKNN